MGSQERTNLLSIMVTDCLDCGFTHGVKVRIPDVAGEITQCDAVTFDPAEDRHPGLNEYRAGMCPRWERAVGDFDRRLQSWRVYLKGFGVVARPKPTIDDLRNSTDLRYLRPD